MTREEFLYRMAKTVSYPTWIAAFVIGILLVWGVVTGPGWITATIVLLGIAMPVGVKLSRMELANTMLACFRIGIIAERKRERDEAEWRRRHEQIGPK